MALDRELELERTVVGAWPALEVAELDGWLLRSSGGPTHRGNSVSTLAASSSLDLPARIDRAEAWYRERGRPPMFQVGPCAAPEGLDAALAARGYRKEGEALMLVADAASVADHSSSALLGEVEATPNATWLSIAAGASRFSASQDVFFGFLARLGERCRFVTARDEQGAAAAVCLGIASEERLGVYAMFTLPPFRRRGAARATLHALAQSALGTGPREMYLLVEASNEAARALYARCRFREAYAYHYRVLDSAAPAARDEEDAERSWRGTPGHSGPLRPGAWFSKSPRPIDAPGRVHRGPPRGCCGPPGARGHCFGSAAE